MPKKPMLQGSFLRRLQEENVPISIFLVSGIKLQGQVHAFDDHVILFLADKKCIQKVEELFQVGVTFF